MSSFPIGDFPIGGFPNSDSQSIANPLPGLIKDPSLAREFLLRSTPLGVAAVSTDLDLSTITDDGDLLSTDIVSTNVDLSSGGYTSYPTDDPYKNFESGISRPYNFSAELPLPRLSGGASIGGGEILIKNSEGDLDNIALLDWLGSDVQNYIGQKDASLAEFTMYSRGTASGVSWGLDSWTLLYRDLRFKLKRRLQKSRYMGVGPCLRFSSATDQVSYGDILDPGSTGDFTVEILFRSEDTTNNKFSFSKKESSGSSAAGWSFRVAWTQFTIEVADGINSISSVFSDSDLDYLDNRLHRASFVVNRTAQVMDLLVDGEYIIQGVNISSVGSFSSGSNLVVGNRGLGSQSWKGDLDDFRYWSHARTRSEILADMHKELVGDEPGLEIYSKYNEGAGISANDSTANNRDGTIAGCTWVGSLEGDSSLANTVKPVAVGIKSRVLPKLVDSQRLVYQVHDGSTEEISPVEDSGDPLTFGADLSNIYASVPAPGTYNTCLAKGLFRLGSSPVGIVTAGFKGDNASPLGYVDGLSDIHRKIAIQYGRLSDDSLNLNTYLDLASKTSARMGFYFDKEINIDVALDSIMESGSSWWSPDRVSRVSVGRIDDPSSQTEDITLTLDDLVDPSQGGVYSSVPVSVRVGQVILGFNRYDQTLSEDQVAGSISLSQRDDLGKEYRFVEATDPNRVDDSDTLTVYTEIYDRADAQAEADRILALLKGDRRDFRITLDQGILSYFIGTVFKVVRDRYDTVGGKKFVCFGISETFGQHGSTDRLEPALFG